MTGKFTARLMMLNYALTTLLSALLLFEVQPIISKFILPWFGGSPAVWTAFLVADFNAFASMGGNGNADVAGLAYDGSWWLAITEGVPNPTRFLTSAGPWVRWL